MSDPVTPAAPANRFRDSLSNGEFVLLVESSSPSLSNDPIAAGERLAAFEEAVLSVSNVNTALAVTDRYLSLDAWRAVEYANALREENRDRHVIYLSGRNTTGEELRQLSDAAAKSRLFNVVPVSGNCVPGDTLRECRKRVFSESVGVIRNLAERKEPFFLGGTTNPYAYTPFTMMGQYFKLVKKLNAGASFVVAQAGWDMLKLQSLRWYFSGRSLFYPMIARLVLLTPNLVEKILAGEYPGINISPDFQKILEKELRYSLNQFEAAQYRRLELQAAGCSASAAFNWPGRRRPAARKSRRSESATRSGNSTASTAGSRSTTPTWPGPRCRRSRGVSTCTTTRCAGLIRMRRFRSPATSGNRRSRPAKNSVSSCAVSCSRMPTGSAPSRGGC